MKRFSKNENFIVANLFGGFKTQEKELFFESMISKLIHLLQGRLLDIMLGKLIPLLIQNTGIHYNSLRD